MSDENLTIPDSVIEFDGRKYRFVVPRFMFPDPPGPRLITATEAINDPFLLEKLIKMNSGVLKQIEENGKD